MVEFSFFLPFAVDFLRLAPTVSLFPLQSLSISLSTEKKAQNNFRINTKLSLEYVSTSLRVCADCGLKPRDINPTSFLPSGLDYSLLSPMIPQGLETNRDTRQGKNCSKSAIKHVQVHDEVQIH